jgi:calcineurin-like phosphoesterase family protein
MNQRRSLRAWMWFAFLPAFLCAHCSATSETPASPSPPGPPTPGPDQISTLVGAGDIGVCGSPAPLATGRLLDNQPGTIFAAGDLAYENGTAEQFQQCYEPAWGRHKSRTRPVPGNHEYNSADAAPYFAYFGSTAGPPGLGYYRYPSGNWQIYALNSSLGGSRGTTEMQWLRTELATQSSLCSLAYFHHPRFSSGPHGLNPPVSSVRDMWIELYNAGVDIVISAHEHFYERFAPQTADGFADTDYGIRQFIVGTGGASLSPALRRVANSEVLLTNFGVLKLTLAPQSYKWEFLSADGGGVLDSGTSNCHATR